MIENIVKILLNVVLISAFIGIFFFAYEVKIEEKIVKDQSTEIIKDFTEEFKRLTPSNVRNDIYKIVEPSLVAPNLTEEDEDVKISNDALIKKATTIIVVFTVVGMFIIMLLCIMFKVNPKDIITNTLVTILFVAITEYVFVRFLVQNYSTIDSNFVRQKMINVVANYH